MVFADDPQYDYVAMNTNRFDLNTLSKAQLIAVNATSEINMTLRQALEEDASEGASVLFFQDDGVVDTNRLAVSDLALKHTFFDDMILELPQHADLPKVYRHVSLSPDAQATALIHLANDSVADIVRKTNQYTLNELDRKRHRHYGTLSFLFRPFFRFFKTYILKGGFRDGKPGFIKSVLDGYYQFIFLAKKYEQEQS